MTVDGLMNGGKVVSGATGDPLGEIYEVSTVPYTEEQNLLDGTIAVLEVPDRVSAYVTITCEGVVNDDGYFIGNNQLCVGAVSYTHLDVYKRQVHPSARL